MRLAGVLEHVDPRFAGQLKDRVHVDGGPEQVHRDHAAHARAEAGCDQLGGEQVGVGVDVDRHRHGAHRATASAVAMNELAGTITSSPGPI